MQTTLTSNFHAISSCGNLPHQLKSGLNFSFGRLDVSVGRVSGDRALDLLATVTRLLSEYDAGRTGATDELAKAVFDDLREMAANRLHGEFGKNLPGLTIQPTIVASDTLMKLIRQRQKYDSRGHLFAVASRKMWEVLLDYHRRRRAQKRGGFRLLSCLHDHDPADPTDDRGIDVEALHGTLERLGKRDKRLRDVVNYRFLWGMSIAETASALGVGHATVERDWNFARAFLLKELAVQ